MTRVPSLISSRVSRSLRSTSSRRALSTAMAHWWAMTSRRADVLFPKSPRFGPTNRQHPEGHAMDSEREDGPGLARAREARVVGVITVALGQRRPVNRFAAGQDSFGRPIVKRHKALEEVVGTLRGPRVVQRRQAIAVATDDVDDQGRSAEPDVQGRASGFHYLGYPVAIGKARSHFLDDGETSGN